MRQVNEPINDVANKLDAKTLACLACAVILTTALTSGLSASMGAAGAAILKTQHPDAYQVGTLAASAAIGTAIIDFAIIFTMLLISRATGCKPSFSTNKSTIVGVAVGSAASTVLGGLLGYSILNAAGRANGMEVGPIAAGAAVGGAVIGGGLAILGCC